MAYQLLVTCGVVAAGMWALFRPAHLQRFIHQNFALLSSDPAGLLLSITIRIAGAALILYGYALASGVVDELAWLRRVFHIVSAT